MHVQYALSMHMYPYCYPLPPSKGGPQEPCPPKSWSWASPSSGEKLSGDGSAVSFQLIFMGYLVPLGTLR